MDYLFKEVVVLGATPTHMPHVYSKVVFIGIGVVPRRVTSLRFLVHVYSVLGLSPLPLRRENHATGCGRKRRWLCHLLGVKPAIWFPSIPRVSRLVCF